MMTDEGMLPDIVPKIKKFERGLTMKLPAYSVGFWVLPEAKVRPRCKIQIKIRKIIENVSHNRINRTKQKSRGINSEKKKQKFRKKVGTFQN